VAAVFAARAAAVGVTILFGGTLADRFRRTHVMIAADVLRAATLLAIVLVLQGASIGMLSALVFVVGLGEAFFRPAYLALVPSLLTADEVQAGNSLSTATARVAGLAGPALAGALIVVVGPGGALLVDAATFLASVVTLVRVREPGRAPASPVRASVLAEAWIGFRAVAQCRWIAIDTGMAAVQVSLSLAPWLVLTPVVAATRLGGGLAYSSLLVGMGVGSVAGAVIGGRLRPRRPGVVASLALLPFTAALLGLALALPLPVLVALHVAAGIGTDIYLILWFTSVQTDVPGDLLGRVFAIDELGSRALLPVAMLVAGSLATGLGTGTILAVGAVVNAATALLPLVLPDVRAFSDTRRTGDSTAAPAEEGGATG